MDKLHTLPSSLTIRAKEVGLQPMRQALAMKAVAGPQTRCQMELRALSSFSRPQAKAA